MYDLNRDNFDQDSMMPDPILTNKQDESEERAKWADSWTPQENEEGSQEFWDEVSGEKLPAPLVHAARKEEIAFMQDWQVWEVVPIEQCNQRAGKKPFGRRWVDVNKGDSSAPDVRCRYVAKEIATYKDDAFSSSTPPLEALRMLLSHAASGRTNSKKGRKVLVIDARKAHLHATTVREIYVDLLGELKQPTSCARLLRCLYGTRDAAARWEAFLVEELRKMGFIRGRANASGYRHRTRDLRAVVHGDDFTFVGNDRDLNWVSERMAEAFLVKVVGRLGGDEGDVQELRVLNRVLQWTESGIQYQADPRHIEILIRDVDTGASGKLPSAPGVKSEIKEGDQTDEELLEGREATLYRSWAARANYLGMDRTDMCYAAKELCRSMSKPTKGSFKALVRLVRYLQGAPWLVYSFDWQKEEERLIVYTDTDYAGCLETRKSTSGGVAFRGRHFIKHWSATQKTVTLSSGEAELGGIVKAASEALGLRSISLDLGIALKIELHADSSAAIGICNRTGIGRVRHLAVGQLWIQDKLREGTLKLYKVAGDKNIADVCTKHLLGPALHALLDLMPVFLESERAKSAPAICSICLLGTALEPEGKNADGGLPMRFRLAALVPGESPQTWRSSSRRSERIRDQSCLFHNRHTHSV